VADVISIPVWGFISCMLVASLLLAVWLYTRFERIGPRSITGGFFALIAAMMVISGLPSFMDGVAATQVPQARMVIIFGLALPAFTYLFLAGGWFMRSILGQLPGRLG
jgi:hypothetical protein